MNRKLRCRNCGRDFDPRGWIAQAAGATVYAGTAGDIPLCSAECDQQWLAAKGDPTVAAVL